MKSVGSDDLVSNYRPELNPRAHGLSKASLLLSVGAGIAALFVYARSASPGWVVGGAAGLSLLGMLLGKHAVGRTHRWVISPVLLAIGAGAIALTGGPGKSPLYPLMYFGIAGVAALLGVRATVITLLGWGLVEGVMAWQGQLSWPEFTFHIGFATLFAGLFGAILATETNRLRKRRDEALAEAWSKVEQDAHDFRLIGSSLGPDSGEKDPAQADQFRQIGSVRAIKEGLFDVLEMALVAVHADFAALLVLDDSDQRLVLKECVVKEGEPPVIDRSQPKDAGAMGAVMKTGRSVNLVFPEGVPNLGYRTREPVKSLTAVPVRWSGRITGVLMAARWQPTGFTTDDEGVLDTIGREVVRTMESERIFSAMDRVKYEQERFHKAFALLNEAQNVETFADRLLQAVAQIRSTDLAVVTLYEEGTHTVVGLRGDAAWNALLCGQTFSDKDGGLVVEALEAKEPLPHAALPNATRLSIFGALSKTPSLEALKVFPLIQGEVPLGALIIGAQRNTKRLQHRELRMLETVCTHAAVTLSNARLFRKMETMATTDGLTGLTNHRRFKELLDEALARASRFDRKVSVVMVDADHFKSVNDTYGHPVGDLVLKRIAGILKDEARRTDVVARYGGEEFVVVLDETDTPGALHVAERIRARVEAEIIEGDFGRVRVTASLGLATWPTHADSRPDLMERADQALYEAKRSGRNRVYVARPQRCAPVEDAAIPKARAPA